jgi:hypothetical protein
MKFFEKFNFLLIIIDDILYIDLNGIYNNEFFNNY